MEKEIDNIIIFIKSGGHTEDVINKLQILKTYHKNGKRACDGCGKYIVPINKPKGDLCYICFKNSY